MATTDFCVNVAARITVSDEMAERCLRILEMWQDDNPDKMIVGKKSSDGGTVFIIVNKTEPRRDGGDEDDQASNN